LGWFSGGLQLIEHQEFLAVLQSAVSGVAVVPHCRFWTTVKTLEEFLVQVPLTGGHCENTRG